MQPPASDRHHPRRRAFWEGKHRTNDRYWLTGTSLQELLRLYDLQLSPGALVTEIGVGTGRMTRELVDAGCTVTAVDIVDGALARVRDVAHQVAHVELLRLCPPADLAICHLVAQHVDTPMLRHLLTVPLARTGMLCVQTAWMDEPPRGLAPDMAGLVWHEGQVVERLLADAGLRTQWRRRLEFTCKGDRVHWELFRATRGG